MTMFARILIVPMLLLAHLALGAESRWVDSITVSVGKDNDTNKTNAIQTNAIQLGLQNKWNRTWFNDGAWFVGGFWDVSLAYLKSDINQDTSLMDLSLTPFLRLQRDAQLSSGVTPFSQIGLGGHLLSDTELGNRDLATRLQFGPQVGVGLGFGQKGNYELTYRYQYLTNGGIKQPNDGLKMHFLSFGYAFR
ncbi:MAG: acyloxyacyl hydrolase [Gammaproteobacteria bacterium]